MTMQRKKRKLTPAKLAEVQALKKKGIGQRDIAAKTGLSKGTITNALRDDLPAVLGPQEAPADAAPIPDLTGVTDEETLTAALASLHAQRAIAKANRDVARSIAVEKAIVDATSRRAKLRPPAPPNPNDDPKWRELAERFRKTAHERLDRILEKAGVSK